MAEKSVGRWQEQLKKGGLELAILAVMATEPKYGLEILRQLNEGEAMVVSEGTIYPILGRLTREGWLHPEWRDSGVHPRKYYRLTESGRERLIQMVDAWAGFTKRIQELIDTAAMELKS